MSEGDPAQPAHDVREGRLGSLHQKLGQCLIRLQQIEVGLKCLSSRKYLEVPVAEFAERHEQRVAGIRKHTLGTLTGDVLNRLIVEEDWTPPTPELDDSAPPFFAAGIAIGLDPDSRTAVAAKLEDLVRRRNLIVHGLLTEFDLDTEIGREAAEFYLDETFAEAESVRAEVRLWVESAAELGEMLTQPDVLARLFVEPSDPQ